MKGLTRKIVSITAVAALAAAFSLVMGPAGAASGRYIVVLKNSVSNSKAVASEHARSHRAEIGFVYSHALKGYSAVIPESRLAAVRRDSRVAYVEPDGIVSIVHHECGHTGGPPGSSTDCPEPAPEPEPTDPVTDCTGSTQTLPWGINRIDADLSSTLAGNCSGTVSNVNVYVIDTGADAAHPDLNVVNHVNFAGGPNKDCNGHGTHVAGTIAAKDNLSDVVGVAPGAPITGVKVLSCSGSGSYSGVIKGVDWVTANAKKPAIANMSLGGGASQSVDDAVKRSADSGVFYSIAAGNSGEDACEYSPARAGTHNGVMTVGATDSNDNDPSWSNYGTCVDIWAPGASILSTKSGGGTTTMSGTSMAAPHAGGASALYLSTSTSASAATVEGALKANAESTGTLANNGAPIILTNAQPF
ncbi:MAG: S8 family peptidase [Actinobacteria bacterium]|nr:S8 family peptidase [Actinomycetota bacterium]